MLPHFSGARADVRATLITATHQSLRPLLIGEAPRVRGAPPFAEGTVARTELARLLGIPGVQLAVCLELDNVLDEPQPRQGWGRAFDKVCARKNLSDMLKRGRFDGRDVVFGSWRLSRCAAQLGLPIPYAPATFSGLCRHGTRYAWFAHACDTAGVYAQSPGRAEAVRNMTDQTRWLVS